MASTVQTPPPAPPTRPPRFRRSFAGPVVLIIVGIFFLLSNMGIISWNNFGLWFSHYWPVLRMGWGLSKQIESQIHVSVHKRVNADRQEQADEWNKGTRPQISVTGQVVTVEANTRGAGDHRISSDLEIALPRKASLVVSAGNGDISIMGRDGS